jgi:hypothetical protein
MLLDLPFVYDPTNVTKVTDKFRVPKILVREPRLMVPRKVPVARLKFNTNIGFLPTAAFFLNAPGPVLDCYGRLILPTTGSTTFNNGGFTCDGSTGYARSPGLIVPIYGSYTYLVAFSLVSGETNGTLFGCSVTDATSARDRYLVRINSSGYFSSTRGCEGTWNSAAVTVACNDGKFHTGAAKYDVSTAILQTFLDNTEQTASVSSTFTGSSINDVSIGVYRNGYQGLTDYLNGTLYCALAFDAALPNELIKQFLYDPFSFGVVL